MSMTADARRRLRIVSIIDIIKGVAILSVGFGILHAQSHVLEHGGQTLMRMLDLNENLGAAHKFIQFLHAADMQHGLLMMFAVTYALIRFIEAYGLWLSKAWARWLGLISSGMYVPFELYYFIKSPGWTTLAVLAINLCVIWLLWPNRKQQEFSYSE